MPTASLPSHISWHVDAHTHAAYLQQWLRGCNHRRRIWRKAHLSDETNQLIDAKRRHWRRSCAVRDCYRRGILGLIFCAWRDGETSKSVCRPWLSLCDHSMAWHRWAYDDLAPRVVQAIRIDDSAFYENLAAHVGDESMRGSQALWQAIKPVLPRWRSKRRANLRCTGPSVEDQLQHYDSLEAGHAVSYEDLLALSSSST